MPELFAGMDVGEMRLDDGKSCARDRVPQRDAVVGEGSGIEDDTIHAALSFVQSSDELSFGVRLKVNDRDVEPRSMCTQIGQDGGKGVTAVDLRLSCSEKIEIRAVEDKYGSSHRLRMCRRHSPTRRT